jgi:hypothetical protein
MEVKNCGQRLLLGAWGTFWEHIGNIEGKKKREKFLPSQNPKEKKKLAPLMHAEPSHWLHENFIFSKTIYHQSWPGLITPL